MDTRFRYQTGYGLCDYYYPDPYSPRLVQNIGDRHWRETPLQSEEIVSKPRYIRVASVSFSNEQEVVEKTRRF